MSDRTCSIEGCPRPVRAWGWCNPAHLSIGTTAENVWDRVAHGMQPRGVQHPNAKLTEADVRAIRRRYAAGGCTFVTLAAEYAVSKKAVMNVVKRRTYRNVSD